MSGRIQLSTVVVAALIAFPAVGLLPTPGWAQIEEIIVTTRRREESLQDLPLSVTAITADMIERSAITDLDDIAKFTPSMVFDTSFGPADTRVTLRGLSNTRGRSNVAFLIDGVDATTENLIAGGSGLLANQRLLNDVERIEIVKGPQSALFGRAAFAGAISYVTKEPGDDFAGSVGMDVGEDGIFEVRGAIGGPITDAFGLRLTGIHWSEDGHYVNSISGGGVGGGDGNGFALTGVWKPGDVFKLKTRLSLTDDHYDPRAVTHLAGDTDIVYPQEALDAGLGVGGFGGASLGLADFGNTFRVPRSMGSASGKQIRHSENPFTGQDYPGTDIETSRVSVNMSWTFDSGTITSTTGFVDADMTDQYDQDYQGSGRPDTLIAHQHADFTTNTEQFSTELRYTSDWGGPVQMTVGGLIWNEERNALDRNIIVACMPVVDGGPGVGPIPVTGVCDGTFGTVTGWQQMMQQLAPIPATPFGADTDHTSVYAMLEWQISDYWKLSFETRFVDEDFSINRANQSPCTRLGFAVRFPNGFIFQNPFRLYSEDADPNLDNLCPIVATPNTHFNIQGEENSSFSTPKVTLEWTPNARTLMYLSIGEGQKPGGITVVSAGGSAITIDDLRFLPEKMTAYEFGYKRDFTFDSGSTMLINGAMFFQDYTDKQVSTQVLVDDILQPRVLNASSAEVLGVELDVVYAPAAIDGLTLTASYTYLDATYQRFFSDTTSLLRAGLAGHCPIVYKGGAGPNPDDVSDPANGEATCRLDLSGNRLERSPEHSFVATMHLQRPFGQGNSGTDWFFQANANYRGDRFTEEDNFQSFDSYWMVDLRLGLEGENWDALLYVDNAFDDDTVKTGGPGPDFGEQITQLGFTAGLGVTHWFATLPDPRIIGIRANYRF